MLDLQRLYEPIVYLKQLTDMKHTPIYVWLLAFLLTASFTPTSAKGGAGNWLVEAEKGGSVTWSADSVADIHAPGGLTLWSTHRMRGNVVIEYEARIVSDGRISDLNCFWMASEPGAKDVFVHAGRRGGKFVNSYTLSLYYMGFGGNHNSTTRFRRYDGNALGVTDARHRPAILREYTDSAHLLRGDHWYRIRLEAIDGHITYTIDGERLVDYIDPLPLTEGYFGFRTTLAHAQLRHFRYTESTSAQMSAARTIRLHDVAPQAAADATMAGASFGIPFSPGELPADARLTVTGGGTTLDADQWTMASWPDGSVKWKAVATTLPKNCSAVSVTKADAKQKNNKKKASGEALLTVHTSRSGALFDSISVAGRAVVGRAWVECNGETLPVTKLEREQAGSVRDCYRAEGENFCVRLYAYHSSREIKLVHTAFVDSALNAGGLRSLSLRFEVPLRGNDHDKRVLFLMDSTRVQTMDVKPLVARRPIHLDDNGLPTDERSSTILAQLATWDGFRLSQLSPNGFSVRKRATAESPWIGTIEGQRAPGVVAVGDRSHSAVFHLADFWQSYPSTLQVDRARSEAAIVSLHLWSPEAEAMSFAHYDTIPHGLEASYEDVQPGMSTANGIARTSIVYLTVADQGIDAAKASLASAACHPQYVPTPKYLHDKRAFGVWSLDRGTAVDSLLSQIKTFYAREQEKHAWYGFFNYGDVMHSSDPERGEWRYDVGGYAWDNTELGTPAMLWYEFLRTGDAETWRMAVAMTRHNAEVDTYHRGPHAGLGSRHNVVHWGCGAKEARISQAFWNRFLYYLTTDERMGDVMHEVVDADQLLYHLDPMRLAQPRSDEYPCTAPARLRVGPDWLAYAANWFTEWERTGDERCREKILAGMKSIAALPHGLFSGPKVLGYDPATGIVSWEGDSAVQHTNHLLPIMGGFEMMTEMILSLTTPEWSAAWLNYCAEYKEKAHILSGSHFRIPRLKAYAYWLTGKEAYRQSALRDLHSPFPLRFTNDAATFALDAIFMQEVLGSDK